MWWEESSNEILTLELEAMHARRPGFQVPLLQEKYLMNIDDGWKLDDRYQQLEDQFQSLKYEQQVRKSFSHQIYNFFKYILYSILLLTGWSQHDIMQRFEKGILQTKFDEREDLVSRSFVHNIYRLLQESQDKEDIAFFISGYLTIQFFVKDDDQRLDLLQRLTLNPTGRDHLQNAFPGEDTATINSLYKTLYSYLMENDNLEQFIKQFDQDLGERRIQGAIDGSIDVYLVGAYYRRADGGIVRALAVDKEGNVTHQSILSEFTRTKEGTVLPTSKPIPSPIPSMKVPKKQSEYFMDLEAQYYAGDISAREALIRFEQVQFKYSSASKYFANFKLGLLYTLYSTGELSTEETLQFLYSTFLDQQNNESMHLYKLFQFSLTTIRENENGQISYEEVKKVISELRKAFEEQGF